MRAYLTAMTRWWLPVARQEGRRESTSALLGGAILFGVPLAWFVVAGMSWDTTTCVGIISMIVAVGIWIFSIGSAWCLRRDLRAGVYIRATGPVTLKSHQGEEAISYALVVGDRTFDLGTEEFQRLWTGLSSNAARRVVTGPVTEIHTPAIVSYLAHSGMLLEVRDGAGALRYQHSLCRLTAGSECANITHDG
jgi:hypothetical protein